MAVHHSAETVGCAFTAQYYQVLHHRPEDAHKFYKDSSVASWEGKDGIMHSVTTMEGINEMIMSSDYKDSAVKVKDVYAQDSLQGSILLVVIGNLTGTDDVTIIFSHTFLLARQERGFFVLNDILRFVDMHPSTPDAVSGSANKVSESLSATDSELVEVSEKACTETEPKDANFEPANPSYAEIITNEPISKSSVNSVQPKPAVAEVSPAKEAPTKSSYLETLSKERTCPQTPVTQIVRVSASDGSLVLPKTQAPTSNAPIKGVVSHSKSLCKVATDIPEPTESIRSPKGIYVGGLPPNTTKHELADAIKIFGRVKKTDGIQVILDNKNEDGFTYGFVHFKSEDSARKAVETHTITIRGKEAYITYKKSSVKGGNGRGRSPPARGGFRHGSPSGKGGGSYNGDNGGGAYRYENRNRSSDGRGRDGYQGNGV